MSLSVKLMFVLATVFVAIDFDALRQDVEKSELCSREYTDLNELTPSDTNIASGQAYADEGESGCL